MGFIMKQFGVVLLLVCLCGCQGLRSAATADTAVDENASGRLCVLAELAHDQSMAFAADHGLPKQVPVMHNVEAIAKQAGIGAAEKPDVCERALKEIVRAINCSNSAGSNR